MPCTLSVIFFLVNLLLAVCTVCMQTLTLHPFSSCIPVVDNAGPCPPGPKRQHHVTVFSIVGWFRSNRIPIFRHLAQVLHIDDCTLHWPALHPWNRRLTKHESLGHRTDLSPWQLSPIARHCMSPSLSLSPHFFIVITNCTRKNRPQMEG
jgi:hypothetical protein